MPLLIVNKMAKTGAGLNISIAVCVYGRLERNVLCI